MAEFTAVVKDYLRMCNSYAATCTKCPMYPKKISDECWCTKLKVTDFDGAREIEDIVSDWAKKNPVKTNAMKLKEVFGIDLTNIDRANFSYTFGSKNVCTYTDVKKWLDQEYVGKDQSLK